MLERRRLALRFEPAQVRGHLPPPVQTLGCSAGPQRRIDHDGLGVRRGKKLRTTIADMRMATWQHEHDGHPVAPGQLTQHHDAGSQYTSLLHTEHLAAEGIADSVGSVGAPYDNALMESMIGLYRPSEDPRR